MSLMILVMKKHIAKETALHDDDDDADDDDDDDDDDGLDTRRSYAHHQTSRTQRLTQWKSTASL